MSRSYSDDDVLSWVQRYNDGETIEEIALDVKISRPTVSKELHKHPDYRPRKPWENRAVKNQANAVAKPSGPPITKVKARGAFQGHRRRGRIW